MSRKSVGRAQPGILRNMSEDRVKIQVLGPFSATLASGEVATFRTNRAAEVLARLALAPSRSMDREGLATEIWPDADPVARHRSFRSALTYARNAIGSEHIETESNFIRLSAGVITDLDDLRRQRSNALATVGFEDHLVQLMILDGMENRVLLQGWTAEWIDPYRTLYEAELLDTKNRLGEELASRGQWERVLEVGRQMLNLDSSSEQGIRLRLRALGQLERPRQAQREFVGYQSALKQEFGLCVSTDLKQFAAKVISGQLSAYGVSSTTSIQLELINNLFHSMIQEEPDRVMALFASRKLNWEVVLHGPEVGPMLVHLMRSSGEWNADRCAVAKRLLQYYLQEERFALVHQLASQLNQNGQPIDRIAALNYLGMVARVRKQFDISTAYFQEALAVCETLKHDYLTGVTHGNLAMVYWDNQDYQQHTKHLELCLAAVKDNLEPNGVYSTATLLCYLILSALHQGDLIRARGYQQEARTLWNQHQLAPHLPILTVCEGFLEFREDATANRTSLLNGIEQTIRSRTPALMTMTTRLCLPVLVELGHELESIRISKALDESLSALHESTSDLTSRPQGSAQKLLAELLSEIYFLIR